MIVLKQVKHYPDTNSVEATWVDRTITPDTVVPEELLPDTTDDEGNITLGKVIPAHIVPGAVTEEQVKCHSYADVQMDMLRDHAVIEGTPLTDYETLIALVESNIQPLPPAPAIPYTELRRANYPSVGDQLDAIWKGSADFDAMKVQVVAVKAKFPKP